METFARPMSDLYTPTLEDNSSNPQPASSFAILDRRIRSVCLDLAPQTPPFPKKQGLFGDPSFKSKSDRVESNLYAIKGHLMVPLYYMELEMGLEPTTY